LATLTQIYAKANKKIKQKAVMIIPPLKTICEFQHLNNLQHIEIIKVPATID